jgi:hypothetical protein
MLPFLIDEKLNADEMGKSACRAWRFINPLRFLHRRSRPATVTVTEE